MKKFFSLLCATLLVFSASAAPVAKKAEVVKKAPVAIEQVQKVQFEKAQPAMKVSLENAQPQNFSQFYAAPALKVNNQKAQAPAALRNNKSVKAHIQQASAQPVLHKAPAAVKEVINVTDGELYQEPDYIQIWSEAQQLFFIYYFNDYFELNKTYSDLADMYTVCTMNADYEEETATAYSITITQENELLHIDATMTMEDGTEYAITYQEVAFVPSGVKIDVVADNYAAKYKSSWEEYEYTASNDDYSRIYILVYTEEELGTFNEEVDATYCYLVKADASEVWFHSVATPIVVAQDEDGNKSLTGSLYAKNGDEYVFNLTYEKPDAKEITLVADTLNFFTKMLSAGYYQMQGYTVDSTYEFSFYFISKSLSGNYTEEDMDAYSTWVDQKDGKKTVVSYQNLSAANIQVTLVKDTVYYVGTMTLATNDGQEANITLNLSCPYKQEWGEWADFAPFDKNTGKYTFATLDAYTQTGVQVLTRKDNTGLKQFNLKNWGKGYFDGVGMDLILNMNPDNTFSFISDPINLGADVVFADVATAFNNPAYASYNSYDPETGVFSFYTAVVFASSGSVYTAAKESLVMDRPITERDTVDIVSTKLNYNPDYLVSNKLVIYYANDVEGYYVFRVTSNNATSVDGTFKWSDGTISNLNSYFSVTGSDKTYFQDGEFTVVTNDKDIALTGWMIGTDEKYYRLDMSYTAPATRDTVRFSGQGVTISECTDDYDRQTGWFYELTDASTGYRFLLQSTVVAEKYGTFSYADKTLGNGYYNVFDPKGNRQQFKEGSITVGEVGDSLILDGELIAEDEKVYILHFAQANTVLNFDTDAPFDATFAYSDMSTSIDNGVIGIYASNSEFAIGLELYADPAATEIPAGVYTISATQEAGTALQSIGLDGKSLTECYAGTMGTSGIEDCWFMVDGTITLEYDEYDKLKVVVNGTNSYGQPVTALVQYEKLEPKSTVTITDGELTIDEEMYAQYGITTYIVENDNYGFILPIYADTIVGDFTEDLEYALAKVVNLASLAPSNIIDVESIVVTGIEKNITLNAKVLGADTIMYEITATGYYGYIQGDAVEGYVGEFAMEEVAIQQVTLSKVKYIYIQGENAAGDQLALVVKGELKDGAIAAGTYNEVMACTGFDEEGQLNPSFVGNNTAVWFIQGGELVVNENGSMAFLGVNSYDAPVAIGFTVPTPEVTDYYLVGWINGAAYGIEGDIDNFGDYHFVDGKVKATFNELSYVQVKDNNKQIYGTATYVNPTESGNATLVANGTEKIGINGGAEYEYTLVVNEDGSLTLSYEVVTVGLRNAKANMKAAKQIKNGQIVIVRENKEYNILGAAL